jgi:hypothetical protein
MNFAPPSTRINSNKQISGEVKLMNNIFLQVNILYFSENLSYRIKQASYFNQTNCLPKYILSYRHILLKIHNNIPHTNNLRPFPTGLTAPPPPGAHAPQFGTSGLGATATGGKMNPTDRIAMA